MTWDSCSLSLTSMDALGQVTNYQHTARREEWQRLYADSTIDTFTYDPVGNRLVASDSSGLTTQTFDALNRVSTVVAMTHEGRLPITYLFDPNGNQSFMLAPSGTHSFLYDVRDQLSSVCDPGALCPGRGSPQRLTMPA